MTWQEMSYNKFQGFSMVQRLRQEYEPDYIYLSFEMEEFLAGEILIKDEFNETNISLFD